MVSITITTKNEAANIENCLKSILEQTYPRERMEIIVVDNASTDDTKAIALKYTSKVFNKGPERSAQRNCGMLEKSSGKYLMYLDADMILAPGLIAACVERMENSSCAALHIKEIILGAKFWSKVRRFERGFYDGTVIYGARFFRKEAFARVGGFDESMSGPEDWDLDKKLKQSGKIELLSPEGELPAGWPMRDFMLERGVGPDGFAAVVYHNETEFEVLKYLAKKSYYARSFDDYVSKWGNTDLDIHRQFGFWYRYFGVFLEDCKWRHLLRHPSFGLGMYFLRIAVGVVFVLRKVVT
jgi:glycosyltransferase involved in cell wall biosynthesis